MVRTYNLCFDQKKKKLTMTDRKLITNAYNDYI